MKFVSRIRDLRLIKKPADRTIDDQRRVTIIRGEAAEFTHNQYQTDNPEMIKWMLNHHLYNLDFTAAATPEEISAFKEDPNAKGAGDGTIEALKAEARMIAQGAESVPVPDSVVQSAPAAGVDLGTINRMIDEKIGTALTDILAAIKASKAEEEKPKKTVHCSGCGKEFPSGWDLARHRKAGCPGKVEEVKVEVPNTVVPMAEGAASTRNIGR